MPIQKVLDNALGWVGYTEKPNNDTIFAKKAGHPNHQPWCATFVRACFVDAGEANAIPNTASVNEIYKWAVKNNALVTKQTAKAGDLVIMNFDGNKIPDHIGIMRQDFNMKQQMWYTIEGNTSDPANKTGSQSNGDGVYKKERPLGYIFAIVRPKWSTK